MAKLKAQYESGTNVGNQTNGPNLYDDGQWNGTNSKSSPIYAGYQSPEGFIGAGDTLGSTCLFAQSGGAGNVLYSKNSFLRLVVQTDANVVEYDTSGDVMWTSYSDGGHEGQPTANYRLCMQSDGNVVEYSPTAP